MKIQSDSIAPKSLIVGGGALDKSPLAGAHLDSYHSNLITNATQNTLFRRLQSLIASYHTNGIKPDICIITGYFNAQAFFEIARFSEYINSLQIILGETAPAIQDALKSGISFFFDPRDYDLLKVKDLAHQLDEIRYQRGAQRFIAKDFVDIFTLKKDKDFIHAKLYILYQEGNATIASYAIIGSSNFTASGLGIYEAYANKELNLLCDSRSDTRDALMYFKEQKQACISCKDSVLASLEGGFFHHTPSEILSKIKSTQKQELLALNGTNDKSLESIADALKLFSFQKDAAKELIRRLETYGVALLADPVGAGKTLIALALTGVYQKARIITPPKLKAQWESYFASTDERICKINKRIYTYDEARKLKDHEKNEFCDLVIIDESHNLRNGLPKGSKQGSKPKSNNYTKLKANIPENAKVLLLSATPINNSFLDLANQLSLYKDIITSNKTGKSLDPFKICNVADNALKTAHDKELQTSKKQAPAFEDDFYNLTHIVYGRDSSFIEESLKNEQGIELPKPQITKYSLSSIPQNIDFSYQKLLIKLGIDSSLESNPSQTTQETQSKHTHTLDSSAFIEFAIYDPYKYLPKDIRATIEDTQLENLGEYTTPRGFIAMSLLKSLESSLDAFLQTLTKIIDYHKAYSNHKLKEQGEQDELDSSESKLFPKRLAHLKTLQEQDGIDYIARLDKAFDTKITKDLQLLEEIRTKLEDYDSKRDFATSAKFLKLCESITALDSSIHEKKLIIFTESIITAKAITSALKERFLHLRTETINGDTKEKDFQTYKNLFSPKSSGYTLAPNEVPIDILVASDVLSEGQNLQDCANLINWDIAFNPVRAIQRTGRIHRIGSSHKQIHITHFFPDIALDSYIKLESKLALKIAAAESGTHTTQNPFDTISKEQIKARLEAKERRYSELNNTNLVAFSDDNKTEKYLNSSLDFALNELAISSRGDLPNGVFSIAKLEHLAPNTIIAFLQSTNAKDSENVKYYCARYEMDSHLLHPSATNESSSANLKAIFPLKNDTNLESLKSDFKALESITQDYQDIRVLQSAFSEIHSQLNTQIQSLELSQKVRGSGITAKTRSFILVSWILLNPNFDAPIWRN